MKNVKEEKEHEIISNLTLNMYNWKIVIMRPNTWTVATNTGHCSTTQAQFYTNLCASAVQ